MKNSVRRVSEKNGTFICELITERYIYLRNTQKQLIIKSYGRNKRFLEFYLVSNGVCLKLLGSLVSNLGDFASLCNRVGGGFSTITSDVLTTLYSVVVYFHILSRCPSSANYTQKLAVPQFLPYQRT